jgi:hypothetical protein
MRAADGATLVTPGPIATTCAVCGGALIDRYWVIEYPALAHLECIDWSRRAFPFAWRIGPLRFLERTLSGEAQLVAKRVRYVHEVAASRWPDKAVRIIDGCQLEADKARARLSALGVERRHLQRF